MVAVTSGYGTPWLQEGSSSPTAGWTQPASCPPADTFCDALLVESGRVKREVLPTDPLSPFRIREFDSHALAYPWHFHPEIELTFIRNGRGLRYVADSIGSFEDGDLCLVGSGTSHCWVSDAQVPRDERAAPDEQVSGPFSFVVVQFTPDVFGPHFLELPAARPIKDLLTRALLGTSIRGGTRSAVADALEAMLRTRTSPLERLAGLLELLTRIAVAPSEDVVTLALTPGDQPQGLKQEQRVRRLISHIKQNATQSLPEREVAALVGLSPAAFSRFFRRSFGKPFVRYVAEVRVGHACRLLAESEDSIADIAFEVGFNNLANFNRRFRTLKGMTPSAYRGLARRAG
jgi:AraC-like DNA-binding protein